MTGAQQPDGADQSSNLFTDAELTYLLSERRLGRLATVGPDGTPHERRWVGPWGPAARTSRCPAATSLPPRSSETWLTPGGPQS